MTETSLRSRRLVVIIDPLGLHLRPTAKLVPRRPSPPDRLDRCRARWLSNSRSGSGVTGPSTVRSSYDEPDVGDFGGLITGLLGPRTVSLRPMDLEPWQGPHEHPLIRLAQEAGSHIQQLELRHLLEAVQPDIADQFASAVSDHATPVGSGTVARTKRIPVEQRGRSWGHRLGASPDDRLRRQGDPQGEGRAPGSSSHARPAIP